MGFFLPPTLLFQAAERTDCRQYPSVAGIKVPYRRVVCAVDRVLLLLMLVVLLCRLMLVEDYPVIGIVLVM